MEKRFDYLAKVGNNAVLFNSRPAVTKASICCDGDCEIKGKAPSFLEMGEVYQRTNKKVISIFPCFHWRGFGWRLIEK